MNLDRILNRRNSDSSREDDDQVQVQDPLHSPYPMGSIHGASASTSTSTMDEEGQDDVQVLHEEDPTSFVIVEEEMEHGLSGVIGGNGWDSNSYLPPLAMDLTAATTTTTTTHQQDSTSLASLRLTGERMPVHHTSPRQPSHPYQRRRQPRPERPQLQRSRIPKSFSYGMPAPARPCSPSDNHHNGSYARSNTCPDFRSTHHHNDMESLEQDHFSIQLDPAYGRAFLDECVNEVVAEQFVAELKDALDSVDGEGTCNRDEPG